MVIEMVCMWVWRCGCQPLH